MDFDIFDINKFNVIQDEENYYFFRALNMADNADIEQQTTTSTDGKIERIRTDRERFDGDAKYTEASEISLEEIYDHIKMHYRKDTNCISLTSNANIAVNYGRGSYKDKYVMVKIPKKEFGEKTLAAGQYMLKELYSKIQQAIESLPEDAKQRVSNAFEEIDKATESKDLKDIIAQRYTANREEVSLDRAHLRKGIIYSSPKARISNYQSLDDEQVLEVNKVYAKLAILENEQVLKHVIPHSSNSKLRETIGSAFSSTEVIHYGDIKQENIIEVPKEVVDLFALIQQIDGLDKGRVEQLKRTLITAVQNGVKIPAIPEIEEKVKADISIEEMYGITDGKVEYGKANSIVKNMFYLSKARKNAIQLSNVLSEILGQNSGFEDIIQYIRENGFRVEPEIITRQSNKGVKLSESVSLDLQQEEQILVNEIKKLSFEELDIVLKNSGLYNAKDIITNVFSSAKENEKIDKSRYYAEAVFSKYNWQDIGIAEFKTSEKNELIARLQERNCAEIYEKLRESGVEESIIPTVLLNIATRDGIYEQYVQGNLEQILNTRQDVLQNNINIEVVERFLGYYEVENTGIRLKDYQQRACNNINTIFQDHKFAQVILPTGAGKSFVALTQMQQYAKEHPNEKMLYLAPQDEILNQIKSYIVKYVHGEQGTVGKTEDEIIAEVFPNITFETYSGLLAKRGQEVIKEQYGMIVLDELHRTGAKEWEGKIDKLLKNQAEEVKVLGITATPTRDADGRDMANETAKKLGYTDEEISQRKHLAANMTLENAIRMGYVVNPKLVYCKYDLISSGKMVELKAQIDSIEDENKRAEELEKYDKLRAKLNKEIDAEIGEEARKKLEEDARRNFDRGIGKEEIIKQNVKKGGKYIVFIPVSDQGDIEDEDGNKIGTKTGDDKIKAYQDYLNKIFAGTDIVPQLHAMSGAWNGKGKNKEGKDKNQQELDAFEADNSEETKFMVVMNKANEGLHIDGVDGIIWFRALDENSRILYLQQLGRVIYALDEDNPLPDDKRPVVIDLANNSLTVKIEKDFENVEPIDDLESLKIVAEWINEKDGIIPDKNSSNKQEQHYYAILRRIQNKYSKYLDGFENFEDLTEEDKSRIEEIIDLATEIDLWNIDLPPIPKSKGSKEDISPFAIEGVLRDFVEVNEEVEKIENEHAMTTFVKVCEALARQGFDFKNFVYMRNRVNKTLADIQGECPNIDMAKVLEETGVELNYKFSSKKGNAVKAVQGKGTYKITEEEKQKLINMGVISLEKKESVMSEFVRVCEALARQGFDFKNFKGSKTINKKTILKTLADIHEEFPSIDIIKVLKETGVSLDYSVGRQKNAALQSVKENAKTPITEEEKQKLISLGVINLEKKESEMSKFVRVCEALARQGFDFKSFIYSKTITEDGKKKKVNKTLADVQEECPNVDIIKVLEETSVSLDYSIGRQKKDAVQAVQGKRTHAITEEEEQKLINMGVVSLEKEESAMSEFVRVCEALSRQGVDLKKFQYSKMITEEGKKRQLKKTLADVQEEYPNIDIIKVLKETGVSLDYSIGRQQKGAVQATQGKGTYTITEEEKQELIELGVVSLEKESSMSEFVRVCEALSRQGFDFKNFVYMRNRVNKTLADIQGECPNIDMAKVLEETGVELNYKFSSKKGNAVKAVQGKGTYKITEEEKQKLINMGVISLEKKESVMSEFVRVCEALARQGFDFKNFKGSKTINKKTILKTLADIHEEFPSIDIIKVLEETGVELNYKFSLQKNKTGQAVQGKGTTPITEEEKQKLDALGVIDLEEIEQTQRLTQAKKQRDAAKVQNDKAQELEQQVEQALDQQKKRRKKDEGR